jgi:cysteine desulfurase
MIRPTPTAQPPIPVSADLQPSAPPHPAFSTDAPEHAPIYLDYNATTPTDPRVTDAIQPALREVFGNPSSGHAYGPPARTALDRARAQVAHLIGADLADTDSEPTGPGGQIVFTGSGSEADALAIRGTVLAALADHPDRRNGHYRPQVITQSTEHPAVLAACNHLARWHNVEVTVLPVDDHGRLDPAVLAAALTDRTVLVTVMHANNETGTLQPITELAALAHQAGALFHTDAAQTAGKIPLDVTDLGVDLLTLVGHKMYAPKGIAALYTRGGLQLEPLVGGGGQEAGLRAGTENVALAVGLGTAAQLAAADLTAGEPVRLAALRDRLHHTLDTRLPGRVLLNGHPTQRLPHTLNLSITGATGDTLLAAVPSIAASTGSACHSGHAQPSPVLTAMGLPPERAVGALRLSLGRWTTPEQVDHAAASIARATAA